jgi:hypothetical protein
MEHPAGLSGRPAGDQHGIHLPTSSKTMRTLVAERRGVNELRHDEQPGRVSPSARLTPM